MAKGKRKGVARKMPKLEDFQKTVPKGGLLNPGLRKGFGSKVSSIRPMSKPKGNFKNVGI